MQSVDDLLNERFGLKSFRPGQLDVINALISHGSALAVFPTGGGKSLCYQLPALLFDGVTVVVSPLIALMKDQIDFLCSRGIEAARLDSTLTLEESRDVTRKLQNGELRLLYVAPERLNNERFLAQLGKTKIALFAVDEAHCISEWGHNFRPDYLKLATTAQALKVERVLALTATATPSVVRDICAAFKIPEKAAFVTGFERPNLFLGTTPVSANQRCNVLISRLKERSAGSSIVYVTLQATSERIAKQLSDAGLPARAYHAGMKDDERTDVQEWWKKSDKNIVVATIAFGMGIDKADVRYVYHYNLPKGLESYSQEIGRAGRDGLPSIVEILGGKDDVARLENFAYGDTPSKESLKSLLQGILVGAAEFDVNEYELSSKHDIRALVLRTALTYLELLNVVRKGTPYYAGYRVRLNESIEKLLARLPKESAIFLQDVLENSKFGREWYTIDPEKVAEALNQPRERVVKALDYIHDKGWAEVEASDIRQRFTREIHSPDINSLVDDLIEKFQRREENEIARIKKMLELITHDACQTNFLLNYFGELRQKSCGHCTYCSKDKSTSFPVEPSPEDISAKIDRSKFEELRNLNKLALAQDRQCARFLCGLTSPALTKAKLTRHPLFGSLEAYGFSEVLHWTQNLTGQN